MTDFFEENIRDYHDRVHDIKEILLHAYLYLNLEQFFSGIKKLLLHESDYHEDLNETWNGDFVFLTEFNRILIVETKYIRHREGRNPKHTCLCKRVLFQSLLKRKMLNLAWGVPEDLIDCAVFTTDHCLVNQAKRLVVTTEIQDVVVKHVTLQEFWGFINAKQHVELETRVTTGQKIAPGIR
ncbi:MAG: hypothetical protein ACFFD4_24225 [Candidatus Odinarchaeota archaeon]